MTKLTTAILAFLFLFNILVGQSVSGSEKERPMVEVEQDLLKLATDILHHDSTDLKFALNQKFASLLTNTLKRRDSYAYPFDSLKTVSILKSPDGEFRIFTWHIVDKDTTTHFYDKYYAHYYYGLVQRNYTSPDGSRHIVVIPLIELENIPRGYENLVVDNKSWFGALYYQPKNGDEILSYDGHYYELTPKKNADITEEKNQQIVTFVPGKIRKRKLSEGSSIKINMYTRERKEIRYYVLNGWNGWDEKSNYKVMEILTFDPDDSSKVVFGAPIIYFENIPKTRGLFKYSENAPFSLNTGYVKKGLVRKELMIVYDHLAPPRYANDNEMYWEIGPDGSYDALWYQKKLGVFMWLHDVDFRTDDNKGYNEKALRKQLKRQKKLEDKQKKALGDPFQSSN